MEMNTYKIKITESLEIVIEVLANSEEEAISTVKYDYKNEKHILDYTNHTSTEFILV